MRIHTLFFEAGCVIIPCHANKLQSWIRFAHCQSDSVIQIGIKLRRLAVFEFHLIQNLYGNKNKKLSDSFHRSRFSVRH